MTTAMETARPEWESFLLSSGARVTSARRKVASTAFEFKDNFTAEELYAHMRQAKQKVSRATVYRTLKLLSEYNVLKAVDTGEGVLTFLTRFSKTTPLVELMCTNCGHVETRPAPFMQWYAQSAAEKVGLSAVEGRLLVRGECLRRKNGRCPHSE